ncbi:MAG: class I SAM-dependent methyltransferase [Solirubrobacterales bacterium]
MTDAYQEDLAQIHDDGFGFIARGAADTLLRQLSLSGHRGGGLIVELACGGGISSRILADGGYEILGYDISQPMIEIARGRVSEGRFEVESLYDAVIPECRAVTAIGEAFNYLFDPRAGISAMRGVFARAFAALAPGGLLIFDVAQPGRGMPRLEHNIFQGDGWRATSEVIEQPGANLLQRRVTTVRQIGREARSSEELHELVLYDPDEVFAELTAAGFSPRQLASYSTDYHFGLGHGGYVAAKPR